VGGVMAMSTDPATSTDPVTSSDPAPTIEARGVVILSPERWDGVPTNKKQLARRFCRSVPTLYVNATGRSVVKVVRARVTGRSTPRLMQPADNLWSLEPAVLPETLARRSVVALRLNRWLVQRSVRRAVDRLALQGSVVFVYPPIFAASIGKLGDVASVYHCVDHYGSFPAWNERVRADILAAEQRLLAKADVVIATSPALTRHCRRERHDAVELLNVADFDLFHTASGPGPTPPDVAGLTKPIILFHGALSAYKVDFDLLEALASRRPDWSFVLIGPQGDLGRSASVFTRLTALPNVSWLGPKEQGDLPDYLRVADVLLLPYVLNEHTSHIFPLKFFEYLATGKPIVSTRLEALMGFADLVSIADDPVACERMIDAAILSASAGSDTRTEVARRHTWDVRVESIRDLLLTRAGVVVR